MIKLIENCDLKDYTVIIPSVSVGNVGQLTSDLLISSLRLRKLGYVWHPNVLPLAGAEPLENPDGFSTGCELFCSHNLKLVVFQIRSAFSKGKANFCEYICDWLKNNHVKQFIILSGMSAHERRDQQLIGEPLRYVFCPITKERELENASSRGWIELESKSSTQSSLSYIPGSGITVKLFQKCVEHKIPCSLLLEFCSDGNNIPDALKLVEYVDQWLLLRDKLQMDSWTPPQSWKLLFGSLPPTEIFN